MGDDVRGKRPVVPDGLSSDTPGLVLWKQDEQPREGGPRVHPGLGAFWSSLGSALVSSAPVMANVLIAFGFSLVIRGGRQRDKVMALLVALAAGTISVLLLSNVYNVPSALIAVMCAYVLTSQLARDRLNTNGLLVMVCLMMVGMLGVDMMSTALQGSSITQLITSVVNETVEADLSLADLDGKTALLEARDMLLVYWPTLYFLVGAGIVMCSLAGALSGERVCGDRSHKHMVDRYDVPLWAVALFAIGVAIEVVGPRLPSWQNEAAMVGANVVLMMRLTLVQQGLSVLLWWLHRRRSAWPVRALGVLVALWLEASFALTSMVGLVDVVINFRHLKRNRPDLITRPVKDK